ncbi:MAG: hypothetical protein ACXWM8_06720 [Candidatus Limnocylindrales bacterium]
MSTRGGTMGLLDGLRGTKTTWQTSAKLRDVIRDSAVGGMTFYCQTAEIEAPDTVGLEFVPQVPYPVPDHLTRPAGLALRCKVGLTLPLVARAVEGAGVSVIDAGWRVNLGSGVPMPAVAIRYGGRLWGPLQVGSEWEGSLMVRVWIHPLVVRTGDINPLLAEFGYSGDTEILSLVAAGFENLGKELVTL